VAEFPATPAGYGHLLGWLGGFGTVCLVGIEGTGSYGAGLARHIAAAGVRVVEVDRADRQDRRLPLVKSMTAARSFLLHGQRNTAWLRLPDSRGANGSLTSYCFSSPVPQQATYKPAVVYGQVDVGDNRRHRRERPQGGRQLLGVLWLGRDRDHLPDRPPVTVLVPQPHRRREVFHADHRPGEAGGCG
jgi:hypothetical protein